MRLEHLVTFVALLAAGCDGCHHKPYTPFSLGSGSSAEPVASDAPPANSASTSANDGGAEATFATVKGQSAPGDGKSWPLEGVTVAAPAGRSFATGLLGDVDGDGKSDLLAWSRSSDGLRGEIVFASATAPQPKIVAALPGDLSVAGCTARGSLTQVGKHLALFDYEPRCPIREQSARWIALVRTDAPEPRLALELRVAPLPEGQTLSLAIDDGDRDHDGRSDITLSLTLDEAHGSASTTLAWLDRPAGLSRDDAEPEASRKAAAAKLASAARRKNDAEAAFAGALAFEALDRALCSDGGRATITTPAGAIACGSVKPREDAAAAAVEAALTLGDSNRALAAVARLDAIATKKRSDLEKLLAKKIPSVAAQLTKTLVAKPKQVVSPSFSPLAFLPSGDLLIRGDSGVVRADKSFAEAPEPAATFADHLSSPPDKDHWELTSVGFDCAEHKAMARFGDLVATLPLAGVEGCGSNDKERFFASQRVAMLGDLADGSAFAVGSEIVVVPWSVPPKPALTEAIPLPANGIVPLGAARSPDGRTIALATSRGVLVQTLDANGKPDKGKLWSGTDLDGAALCVPASGGNRLACVQKGAAAIFDSK